ncbi:MAG TPA: class I SAM-dependent methyltransferase [Ktedonobacterales bacterium]
MADTLFEEPRLADIYDLLDRPDRPDLDPYVAMAAEFGARSIIDLGCGTGILARRLAALGYDVVGIDPAAASLAVARRKPDADRVRWVHGTALMLTDLRADLIVMTGNVAQVFVADEEWLSTLRACREALHPGGRLVFEVRDPTREAWTNWTRERTYQTIEAPSIGTVESWVDPLRVRLPLVAFRYTFVFHADGAVLTSNSTLRFRSQPQINRSLRAAGLAVESVREAPDRPGLEFVFITHATHDPPSEPM